MIGVECGKALLRTPASHLSHCQASLLPKPPAVCCLTPCLANPPELDPHPPISPLSPVPRPHTPKVVCYLTTLRPDQGGAAAFHHAKLHGLAISPAPSPAHTHPPPPPPTRPQVVCYLTATCRHPNSVRDPHDLAALSPPRLSPNAQPQVVCYLATLRPDQGGVTTFHHPKLHGLAIPPRQGDALIFFPSFEDGTLDMRMAHSGRPVLNGGEKWIINTWACQRPVPSAVQLPPAKLPAVKLPGSLEYSNMA